MSTETKKVLIAGAGPAGAALAQILRKNNIAYELFEREDDLTARRGGSFWLDSALPGLDELLPDDMGDYVGSAAANSNVGEDDAAAVIDAVKGLVISTAGAYSRGQPNFGISARRQDWRAWMLQHLNVQTNKRLDHYEEDEEGVTAYFTDGTSTRGTLLVGADGVNSAVRRQLVDERITREYNQYVPICGDMVLPQHALEPLRKVANALVLARTPETQLSFQQLDIEPDRSSARWWFCISFNSENPEADTAWVRGASKISLYNKVMEITKAMPDILVDTMRYASPEGMWTPQIKFTEWVPPKNGLPRGRVTLLGDAGHNTTPFGGMGANISLRETCHIGRLLTNEKWDTLGDLLVLLHKYEKIMIPRGREVVLRARAEARNFSRGLPREQGHLREGAKILAEPIPLSMSSLKSAVPKVPVAVN